MKGLGLDGGDGDVINPFLISEGRKGI